MTKREANEITGGLGKPSKMPMARRADMALERQRKAEAK